MAEGEDPWLIEQLFYFLGSENFMLSGFTGTCQSLLYNACIQIFGFMFWNF